VPVPVPVAAEDAAGAAPRLFLFGFVLEVRGGMEGLELTPGGEEERNG
jgi:hypothetical protein